MTARPTGPRLPLVTRGLAAVIVGVIGAFLVAGCGSPQGGGDSSLGAQALQNLSPFEKSVLKDKYVTATEFDESMQVYTECLTAAGMTYEIAPGVVGMGSVMVQSLPGEDPASSDTAMQRCVDEVQAVENVWILQKYSTTQPAHQWASGPFPLPGLKAALKGLDTSGW